MKTNNQYTNKRVEFHILQSFPVTCLNRDDVGAPKTAIVGGVTRARVSSQCWKRAVRLAMHEVSGVELGNRTKCLSSLINASCRENGATEEQALNCANFIGEIFKQGDDGRLETLIFLSPAEIVALTAKMKEVGFNPEKLVVSAGKDKTKPPKDVADIAKLMGEKKFVEGLDGLDIALFGRMVAQAPVMDVEASASFSHAISTHKVTNEVEFFTALDDFSEEQGSAHMGSLEFNAATYYRYICLDLGQLYETLGSDDNFEKALEAFIKALYVAVPAARQTTQSGASSWDYAKVFVRKGQRLQLSCEAPVKAKEGSYLNPSKDYVKTELAKKEKLSGSLFGKIAEFDFGEDESFSIDDLITSVTQAVKA